MPKPTDHLYLVIRTIPVFLREVKIFGKVTFGVSMQILDIGGGVDPKYCNQPAPGYS